MALESSNDLEGRIAVTNSAFFLFALVITFPQFDHYSFHMPLRRFAFKRIDYLQNKPLINGS